MQSSLFRSLVMVGAMMGAVQCAEAGIVSFSYSANGSSNPFSIAPGGTQSISLFVTITQQVGDPPGSVFLTYAGGRNVVQDASLGTLAFTLNSALFTQGPLSNFSGVCNLGAGTYLFGTLDFTAGQTLGSGQITITQQAGNPSQTIQGQNCLADLNVTPIQFTVPEPGALALVGMGGLVGLRRRR